MIKISKKVRLALRNLILKCGEVATDKGKLLWDTEEDLKAGDEVFVEGEEGEVNPAPDGEYVTDDNKTIVVVDGKVSAINDPEAEIEAEDEPEAEPADEPEQEDNTSIEDRVAALENGMAELRDGIEALTNAIAAVADRLAAVEEKIKGLEEPAAEPAEEGEETEEKFVSKMSYLNRNKK